MGWWRLRADVSKPSLITSAYFESGGFNRQLMMHCQEGEGKGEGGRQMQKVRQGVRQPGLRSAERLGGVSRTVQSKSPE